ncbi:MAG: hypothetical protein ACKVTZ_06035 [Bacteroidia bacterium]
MKKVHFLSWGNDFYSLFTVLRLFIVCIFCFAFPPMYANVNGQGGECDSLFFADGRVEAVKMLATTPSKVSYYVCGQEKGVKYVVKTDVLKKCKYANGRVVKYGERDADSRKEENQSLLPLGLGIFSTGLSFFGWYLSSNALYLTNLIGAASEWSLTFALLSVPVILIGFILFLAALGTFITTTQNIAKAKKAGEKISGRGFQIASLILLLASLVAIIGWTSKLGVAVLIPSFPLIAVGLGVFLVALVTLMSVTNRMAKAKRIGQKVEGKNLKVISLLLMLLSFLAVIGGFITI